MDERRAEDFTYCPAYALPLWIVFFDRRRRIRGRKAFALALVLAAGLTGCPAAKAYAAYQGAGATGQNSFCLTPVLSFTATLTPCVTAGNTESMTLQWYEKKDSLWSSCKSAIRVTADTAAEQGALSVTVSFQENNRTFRYELSNEAGIVCSEQFLLCVTDDGSGVLCTRSGYEEDLSERSPF